MLLTNCSPGKMEKDSYYGSTAILQLHNEDQGAIDKILKDSL